MENKKRSTYVQKQIISATLKLFYCKDWAKISISEIIKEARVSRNSFYRNFGSRENILKAHLEELSQEWFVGAFDESTLSFSEKMKIIFAHCEKNKDFYKRLNDQGLLYLFKDILTEAVDFDPKSSAGEAYMKSYVVYMLYGWIETWLRRDMKENADDIACLFAKV